MDTERLYYQDVYLKECEARVLSCRKEGDRCRVILDRTVFYPEGGGQPADRGALFVREPEGGWPEEDKEVSGRQVPVLDVQEEEEEIVHFTSEEVPEGSRVLCRIDWDRRFDLMQQHSGEHIVSGLIHETFGYDNVGFHMGEDCITIDLSGSMTMDQVREIEARANDYIAGCHSVEVLYPGPEELDHYDYRSKKELSGDVRLLAFPGADLCACCGLHVTCTGEIGLVKILSCHHFREGVRIEMLSGKRALAWLDTHFIQNSRIGKALSVKADGTAEAVDRLQKENYELKGALMEEKKKGMARLAASCKGERDICLFTSGLDPVDVRKCADGILDQIRGICVVLSEHDKEGFQYAAGIREGDIRPLVKEMNGRLSGRGGGKPFFAQGLIQASKEEAEDFFHGKGFSIRWA